MKLDVDIEVNREEDEYGPFWTATVTAIGGEHVELAAGELETLMRDIGAELLDISLGNGLPPYAPATPVMFELFRSNWS